jgi:N6-L-threonylcarbamoyladenine synthase
MRILAIETSCDESSVAYLEASAKGFSRVEQIVATQEIHQKYGGVVPEVAAREHSAMLPPILAKMSETITGKVDGAALRDAVDLIAVTRGPGLITSLRVGVDTARTLAATWKKKLVGVNHIEGHVYSNWLGEAGRALWSAGAKAFPALVLVVSGGHTEVLLMTGHGKYKLLGATRDDASGEAFDKSAKLLGLGYPGGPAISRLAKEGDPKAFDFPRPMLTSAKPEFSFAGLKTSVRYFLQQHRADLDDPKFVRDVAASVEQAIVDVLVAKAISSARKVNAKTLLLAGGVAANAKLRATLGEAAAPIKGLRFVEPRLEYCTDNAAMIGAAAYFRGRQRRFDDWRTMEADPNWELGRGRSKL